MAFRMMMFVMMHMLRFMFVCVLWFMVHMLRLVMVHMLRLVMVYGFWFFVVHMLRLVMVHGLFNMHGLCLVNYDAGDWGLNGLCEIRTLRKLLRLLQNNLVLCVDVLLISLLQVDTDFVIDEGQNHAVVDWDQV